MTDAVGLVGSVSRVKNRKERSSTRENMMIRNVERYGAKTIFDNIANMHTATVVCLCYSRSCRPPIPGPRLRPMRTSVWSIPISHRTKQNEMRSFCATKAPRFQTTTDNTPKHFTPHVLDANGNEPPSCSVPRAVPSWSPYLEEVKTASWTLDVRIFWCCSRPLHLVPPGAGASRLSAPRPHHFLTFTFLISQKKHDHRSRG